jgi:glucose/arabinose dehydrogenase/PKD repeat protein
MKKFSYFILSNNTLTHSINKILLLLVFLGVGFLSSAQSAGFQDNEYQGGFDGVNGITFDANGRAFAWQKDGKLSCRTLNGIWHELLNINDEINTATDSGLKGFALHPNFLSNGFMYLLYEVDRHHLMNFGTPAYDSLMNDHLNASIGRITRYTINTSNFESIIPNSRLVILGNSPTDGFPFIHDSHNTGSLIFGTDGTLLASCGESSATNSDPGSAETTFYAQALTDGILKSDNPFTTTVNENENVGSWRAQMVNCLSGKIIRIDPLTGDGIPSNPFYDASEPRAAKSRVWAMGLRNPFRMTLKPNTGEHLPSAGNPGTIYVGDVGSFRKEEINVVTTGGQNFGWPNFEGIDESTGSVVGIPFGRPEFELSISHTRPAIDFRGIPARAYVQSTMKEIGTTTPNAIPGIEFNGGCSIAGVFYSGSNFPSEYQGRYFHGNFNNSEDPNQNWIIGFSMNSNDELVESHSFLPNALGVTCMAINPINGYLYYTSYGVSIREVKYDLGNQPPTAKATQDKKYGTSPLTVQFNGSQSTDPENSALTYLWNFGDGSPTSTSANPVHVFTSPDSNPIRYDVTLTVTDNLNQTNSTSLIVSVNNTPPVINSTTVESMDVFANTSTISVGLQAVVTDAQTPTGQLNFKWETSLHHNTHFHADPVSYTQSSSITMSPLPCSVNETYFYQVKLTVTDAQGLSAERIKNIPPDCGQTLGDTEKPSTPTNLQLTNLTTSRISFSWTESTDNVGVATYEIFKNGIKIDESVSPSYTATGLTASTFYLFKVTAKDAAGNISPQSDGFGVYTADLVTQDEIIYGDALNANWQNFSSISTMSLSNSVYPYINTRSIKITNPTVDEALILTYNGFPIDTTGYKDGLEFWVYNEGSTSFPFQVQAFATNSGGGGAILGLSANANKWSHFLLDWSILGNLSQVGKISFTLNQSQPQSLYFDEIKLVHCSYMYSVQSGNWNQLATWSCGRVPISTDDITISGGNTVTVPNGVSATLNFLHLLGTLNVQTGAIFDIKNY